MDGDPGVRLTRRGALVLGGLGVAGAVGLGLGVRELGGPGAVAERVTGPADPALPGGEPSCVAATALTTQRTLGGLPLVYDENGEPTSFRLEPRFHGRLEAWFARHRSTSGLPAVAQVWSLGTWIEGDPQGSGVGADGNVDSAGGCASWHNAGRAFDLTRLVDASGQVVVSCRYDLWSRFTGADLVTARTRYWRTVAGLHRDFDSVLTHLWNDLHHSHVHVDDGRVASSGNGGSQLRTRSRAQVQAVQGMLTWVWDEPVGTSGEWDDATRAATGRVLTRIGHGGALTDGQPAWRAFLDATLRGR